MMLHSATEKELHIRKCTYSAIPLSLYLNPLSLHNRSWTGQVRLQM